LDKASVSVVRSVVRTVSGSASFGASASERAAPGRGARVAEAAGPSDVDSGLAEELAMSRGLP
jgi:hypothetical protein